MRLLNSTQFFAEAFFAQSQLSQCARGEQLPARKGESAGFTLIELLAVLAIMGLLMAAMIPAFVAMSKGSKYDVAVNQLRTTLSLTRQWAITHRKNTYVIFPGADSSLFAASPAFAGLALRGYAVVADGGTTWEYITEWSSLPPGLVFVDNSTDVSRFPNADPANMIFSDTIRVNFPETSSIQQHDIPSIGFRPDGSAMSGAAPRELFVFEGFVDADLTTGNVSAPVFSSDVAGLLLGMRVSGLTGGISVREYEP